MNPRKALVRLALLVCVAASLTGCGTKAWLIVDPTIDVMLIAPGTRGYIMVPVVGSPGELVRSANKVDLSGLAAMKMTEEEWDEIMQR